MSVAAPKIQFIDIFQKTPFHSACILRPSFYSLRIQGYMSRILVASTVFWDVKLRLDGGQYVLKDACLLWPSDLKVFATVDGRNAKQPPVMYKTL